MEDKSETDLLKGLAGRIFGLVSRGRETLDQSDAEQWKALALARFEMLKALDAFVAYKEDKILLPVLRHGSSEAVKIAKEIKNRNLALQEQYDAFVVRWSMKSSLSVNGPYRREAEAMASMIERGVAEDISAIEKLLLVHGEAGSSH